MRGHSLPGQGQEARPGRCHQSLAGRVALDTERLARFKREAKVLASLNHPNIAAIYGLEQSGDTHYLVLELVPGETLAERIRRGPIPVAEAVAIAMKIAAALEEAHERGIVHRDLKPANVKITPDDEVKVLDFGLAKAFVADHDTPEAGSSMSPTRLRQGFGEASAGTTCAGVILGTAAYMSLEQAKGKRVNRRADMWAFGAVLYEMLAGRRAFFREDVSDRLAAALRAEPEWDALPADIGTHSVRTRRFVVGGSVRRRRPRTQRQSISSSGRCRARPEHDRAVPSRRGRDPPEVLFEGNFFSAFGLRTYDVTPDGQRFVMLMRGNPDTSEQDAPPALIVVQNWLAEH